MGVILVARFPLIGIILMPWRMPEIEKSLEKIVGRGCEK